MKHIWAELRLGQTAALQQDAASTPTFTPRSCLPSELSIPGTAAPCSSLPHRCPAESCRLGTCLPGTRTLHWCPWDTGLPHPPRRCLQGTAESGSQGSTNLATGWCFPASSKLPTLVGIGVGKGKANRDRRERKTDGTEERKAQRQLGSWEAQNSPVTLLRAQMGSCHLPHCPGLPCGTAAGGQTHPVLPAPQHPQPSPLPCSRLS